MDFQHFDDTFLDLSPMNSNNLFPSSLPASPVLIPEQDGESSLHETSDEEDGLDDNVALQYLEDDCNEGSFGDSEQVVVVSD
jgi:hypothetical protein